jgi:hypothetical protein
VSRGFKRDNSATAAQGFHDRRSFVSLPKAISGECEEPEPHLILYGLRDKAFVRTEIFKRNRLANKGKTLCAKCGCRIYEHDPMELLGSVKGEWNHIRHKPGERCDDPENGECLCWICHREEHVRPRFGQSKIPQQIP